MKDHPKRQRRLERVWLDHRQPMYFLTLCTLNRRPILASDTVHARVRQFFFKSAAHYDWWAGRYVLMPDHLHVFARPGLAAVTLGAWIKALKACVADRQFKWQTGYFDHVLRSHESQSEKWEYIRRNPERAELVKDVRDWPFAGEIDWAQGGLGREYRGDIPPAPRRETRPTTSPPIDAIAAPSTRYAAPVVGPVSRPGAGAHVASRSTDLTHYDAATGPESRVDELAAEEPLELRVEDHSVAVMMRTPGHDRELAAGFLLTENLIRTAVDIFDITTCGKNGDDQIVNVTLRDPVSFDPAKLTRNIFSSSSCGVCSKATIEAVRQSFPAIEDDCRIAVDTLLRLPAALRNAQETFNRTGGLHACALFDLAGNLQSVREDVGRHNALDKLIGHALLKNRLPLRAHVLMLSGRVSFEMMQKALAAGIPILAAISAPTSLAVEFARESGQTLIGFLRGETMNVYAGEERILATD